MLIQGQTRRMTTAPTNATATMASGKLSDLGIFVLAGKAYTGQLRLYAKNSTAGEGLQFDFNGGGATMTSFQAGFIGTPPGSGLVLGTLTTTSIATALTATTATTADALYVIDFTFVVNAAGLLIPEFAEVSHTSGTATVEINSSLSLEQSPI